MYRMVGIVALVMSCGLLCADTIKFKDGTSLQGQIVAEMDDFVMIRIADGTAHKVSKETIQQIIRGKMPEMGPRNRLLIGGRSK